MNTHCWMKVAIAAHVSLICHPVPSSGQENYSIREEVCAGYHDEYCPWWWDDSQGYVKPNTPAGRNIAAAVQFYSEFCKQAGADDLNPWAKDFIREAYRSKPREFDSMHAAFTRAVKKPRGFSPSEFIEWCGALTEFYQMGGMASEAINFPEGFYSLHD